MDISFKDFLGEQSIFVNRNMSEHLTLNEDVVFMRDQYKNWTHGIDSFVCHESHAETVLDMLKGAKGQCRLIGSNQAWSDCNLGVKGEWSADFWYTSDKFESRIVEGE